MRHDAPHIHFPRLEIMHRPRQTVHLTERPNQRQLIPKHLRRRHRHDRLLRINPVIHQLPAARAEPNRRLEQRMRPRRLHHDIEPVRMRPPQLVPPRPLIPAARQLDVLIRGAQPPRQLHLRPRVRRQHQVRAAVVPQQLREAEPGGPRADDQDRRAGRRRDAVEAVDGAGGRLEQRRLGPREVAEMEELGGGVGAVLGEAAVDCGIVSGGGLRGERERRDKRCTPCAWKFSQYSGCPLRQ